MPQPMCRAFLPQLLCPPCLLSSKVAGGHVNDGDHTVVGVDICSCDRGVVYRGLAVGKCHCRPEPCRRPTVCSPASKSQTLALGMTRNFRMTARSSRARGSSAVPPSASKAAVKASSVAANQSERGPSSSSASTRLAFVGNRSQCAELSSRNCSVHHVC